MSKKGVKKGCQALFYVFFSTCGKKSPNPPVRHKKKGCQKRVSGTLLCLYNKQLENNYLVIIALFFDLVVIILLLKKILKEINLLEDL